MARKHSDLAGRRILIVEDEVLVAMEMESLLEEQFCTVVDIAPTVSSALESIRKNNPDAVLLDLNLNGQPTTAVAAMLSDRKIPFIVVTGYVQSALNEPILQDRYIVQKPWMSGELLSGLSQAIDAGTAS